YVTAAANNGNTGYESAYRGVAGHIGGGSDSSVRAIYGTFQNFNPGSGPADILQNFHLDAGFSIELSFQWDSAYLEQGISPLPNYQVNSDMDFYVTSADGSVIMD